MSNMEPQPEPVEIEVPGKIEDDKKRPYKTYAAILSAILSSTIATNATNLPWYVVMFITAAIAGLAVYLTPNPKVYSPE